MAATITIPSEMREKLESFIAEHNVDFLLCDDGISDVEIRNATERVKCSATILHLGGWITCATAWELSDVLAISKGQTGKLLDLLKVKIRECDLGCF